MCPPCWSARLVEAQSDTPNLTLRAVLDRTSGNVRPVADAMLATAEAGMHQWLNVTLIAGGGLVIVGVIVQSADGLPAT